MTPNLDDDLDLPPEEGESFEFDEDALAIEELNGLMAHAAKQYMTEVGNRHAPPPEPQSPEAPAAEEAPVEEEITPEMLEALLASTGG